MECGYSNIVIIMNKKDRTNMKTRTIGIFDSGIGGLSVLARAREAMPDVDFLYYADTAHVPYGIKRRDEIVGYSVAAAKFLVERGAEAMLVACNTATSMAVDTLRSSFSCPIVGMEPAVKPAVIHHPGGRILVCATPATIGGEKLHDLLQRNGAGAEVDLCALPELVSFAEAGEFSVDVVSRYIRSVVGRTDYSACVLGCTHFPYFRDSFRRVFPMAELVDGTEGTVRRLCQVIGYKPPEEGNVFGTVKYYRTGESVADAASLQFFALLQKRARDV